MSSNDTSHSWFTCSGHSVEDKEEGGSHKEYEKQKILKISNKQSPKVYLKDHENRMHSR